MTLLSYQLYHHGFSRFKCTNETKNSAGGQLDNELNFKPSLNNNSPNYCKLVCLDNLRQRFEKCRGWPSNRVIKQQHKSQKC